MNMRREAITVENIRAVAPSERVECVYIGRANRAFGLAASPLANPYTVREHGTTRALALYRRWLHEDIKVWGPAHSELSRLVEMLRRGERVRLLCYCAPGPCHGEIVKAALLWMMEDAR